MFIAKPTPKQLQKISPLVLVQQEIPEKWSDFAPMLEIQSAGRFVKFQPFECQVEMSNLIDLNPYTMILKSRQLGASETTISKFLHWALLRPGFTGVIISRTLTDSYKLSRRVQTMMKPLRLQLDNKSSSELRFANGSKLIFVTPGDSAAVGEPSVSAIMIDEFSLLKAAEQTLASAMPSTAMLGEALRLVIIFTPRSKNHYSYKILNGSNPKDLDLIKTIDLVRTGKLPPLYHWQDSDGWAKVLWHWRSHPVYCDRPDFLRWISKSQKLSWKKTLREFDLSFEAAELQFIDDAVIDACAIGQYELPEQGATYYCGLDTSSVGNDYFCFAVLKELADNELSLVCLYRARRKSMKRHLSKIAAICDGYRPVAGMVECNSFGQNYYEALHDDCSFVDWQRFTASANSNLRILDGLALRMESAKLRYPNEDDILRELRGLEEDPLTGRIAAAESFNDGEEDSEIHDDIPRALALACYCYDQRPKLKNPLAEAFSKIRVSKGG